MDNHSAPFASSLNRLPNTSANWLAISIPPATLPRLMELIMCRPEEPRGKALRYEVAFQFVKKSSGLPYRRANSWSSITSTLRSPLSHLETKDCGRRSARATSTWVRPASRRACRSRPRKDRYFWRWAASFKAARIIASRPLISQIGIYSF